MKQHRLALSAYALSIASMPTLCLGLPPVLAGNAQTPGSAEPAEPAPQGQVPYVPPADVYVPDSSKVTPSDAGKRVHTNILIRNPSGVPPKGISDLSQPQPPLGPMPGNSKEQPRPSEGQPIRDDTVGQ